jgi:hypothetical protein
MSYQKDLQPGLKSLLFSALVLFMLLVCGVVSSITYKSNAFAQQTQINPSMLTNTSHPKIASNTSQNNIISNTTQMPVTASSNINSSSLLSHTPHPKIASNASTPMPQLNATVPKSITNSSLSHTPHPKIVSNSSR